VTYELAQIKLIVENTALESEKINTGGIAVRADDEVSFRSPTSATTKTHQNIQIRSHLTPSGLLFATLSPDTPSFEEFFVGLEDLTNKVDFTKLPHRRSISYEGRFNWKTMYASSIPFWPHVSSKKKKKNSPTSPY
jgi:hypothetical protein